MFKRRIAGWAAHRSNFCHHDGRTPQTSHILLRSLSSDVAAALPPARAKRAMVLRQRRSSKKLMCKDSDSTSLVILELSPADLGEVFNTIAPRVRLSRVQQFVENMNSLYMKSKKVGPDVTKKTGETNGLAKVNGASKVNGAALDMVTSLYPSLVKLTTVRSGSLLQKPLLRYLLSHKTEKISMTDVLESSQNEMVDLEDVLVLARERARSNGAGWSVCVQNREKTKPGRKAHKKTVKASGSKKNTMPAKEIDKRTVRQSATSLLQHLDESLPGEKVKTLCKMFTKYAEGGKTNIEMLKPAIRKRTSTHFHKVAFEIARFFSCHDLDSVVDKDFKSSQRQWKRSELEFVDCLKNVQSELRKELGYQHDSRPTKEATVLEDDVEDLIESYHKSIRSLKRQPKDKHLVFEAMPSIGSKTERQDDPLVSKLVFVDNLPIDIKTETLRSLYTRCGKIASVRIFQQRPDLDPGPLSSLKLNQLRAKKGRRGNDVGSKSLVRQRSPVYALIRFVDYEGYKRATDQSLQLFGMVLEHHDAKSIPAKDSRSLFIEDINSEMDGAEFSRKFGELLQDDWIVCLQSGQDNKAIASSVELRFPTFTDAHRAFEILDGADSGASIQWMRTPGNAYLWWTRGYVA